MYKLFANKKNAVRSNHVSSTHATFNSVYRIFYPPERHKSCVFEEACHFWLDLHVIFSAHHLSFASVSFNIDKSPVRRKLKILNLSS